MVFISCFHYVLSRIHPTVAGFCFHWRQKCWPFGEGSLFSISSLCTVMASKLFLSLSLLKRMVHTSATRSHCTEQRLMQANAGRTLREWLFTRRVHLPWSIQLSRRWMLATSECCFPENNSTHIDSVLRLALSLSLTGVFSLFHWKQCWCQTAQTIKVTQTCRLF